MTATSLTVVLALVRRTGRELRRQPAAAAGTIVAPTIFLIGFSGVFGKAFDLGLYPGDSFQSYIVPVGFLQGAGFAGAAAGVNLARDIESGWFDRLFVAPVGRAALLAGFVLTASLRSLLPASLLLVVGLLLGVDWPGLGGLAIAVVLACGIAAVAASYSTIVALRFRSQQAATLMQITTLSLILLTPAYAPLDALQGWLHAVAEVNPITRVMLGVRQGFVGEVTWAQTWPAVVAVAGLLAIFFALALRRLQRADT